MSFGGSRFRVSRKGRRKKGRDRQNRLSPRAAAGAREIREYKLRRLVSACDVCTIASSPHPHVERWDRPAQALGGTSLIRPTGLPTPVQPVQPVQFEPSSRCSPYVLARPPRCFPVVIALICTCTLTHMHTCAPFSQYLHRCNCTLKSCKLGSLVTGRTASQSLVDLTLSLQLSPRGRL